MRLLFIKLKHIGDALIMTPMLTAVRARHPEAEIHVVVRRGTEGILAGCPAINHLITTTPVESDQRAIADSWKDLRMGLKLRQQQFDYAFDLTDGDRGRWMVGLSQATHRCISTPKRDHARTPARQGVCRSSRNHARTRA